MLLFSVSVSSYILSFLWFNVYLLFLLIGLCVCVCILFTVYYRLKPVPSSSSSQLVIAFFHPYANNGGGGERVLWEIIQTLQKHYVNDNELISPSTSSSSPLRLIVYTGDLGVLPSDILSNACTRFNLPPFIAPVEFVYLTKRRLCEAENYPRFTMLGQSIGSALLAYEALTRYKPHIFFDTTGAAYTYPIARYMFGTAVCCYTHYPTISTDMLQMVWERRPGVNNSSSITSNPLKNSVKLVYYSLFSIAYSWVGRCSHLILTNSSWTNNHIVNLFRVPTRTHILYPPCDTESLRSIQLQSDSREQQHNIISIAQFRPEKDHPLQIRSFARYLSEFHDEKARLHLIGGCRDEEDEKRVEELKQLAQQLNVQNQVEFHLNLPYSQLRDFLSSSSCGLHTMWNEHFGIGIVEYMGAGVIPIAHRSGGPMLDIVKEEEEMGFLASTEEEYAECIRKVFDSSDLMQRKLLEMRIKGRTHVNQFSDSVFKKNFIILTRSLIKAQLKKYQIQYKEADELSRQRSLLQEQKESDAESEEEQEQQANRKKEK